MAKYILLIVAVFALLSGVIFFMDQNNPGAYDRSALLIGNGILATLSFVAFFMVTNALKSSNPNAFIRAKMGSTMLRFFICIILFVGYAYLHGKEGIRPTLFMFLGMYVVYSILESATLAKKGRVGK